MRKQTNQEPPIKRLEKIMEYQKLSQSEVAEMLGVTDRAIRHWLTGNRNMSKTAVILLEKIEKELKIA